MKREPVISFHQTASCIWIRWRWWRRWSQHRRRRRMGGFLPYGLSCPGTLPILGFYFLISTYSVITDSSTLFSSPCVIWPLAPFLATLPSLWWRWVIFCCCFNLDFSEFPPILDFSRIKSLIRFCPDRKYSESALSPPQNLESPKFSLLEQITPMQTVSSRIQFYKIATLSFVFCGSVVSGNVSLRYLPVSFNQAIGATTPFFTAMFAYIMTVRRESWITYVTLIPVVTGVFIASGVCLHSLPTW